MGLQLSIIVPQFCSQYNYSNAHSKMHTSHTHFNYFFFSFNNEQSTEQRYFNIQNNLTRRCLILGERLLLYHKRFMKKTVESFCLQGDKIKTIFFHIHSLLQNKKLLTFNGPRPGQRVRSSFDEHIIFSIV